MSAYRWFRAAVLPMHARKVGRLILVDESGSGAGPQPRTAVYARVSSADQRADLDRQVARVTAWATAEQTPVNKVVEVGSALNGHRRKFLALKILTSMCARLYGKRAAQNRAKRALAAAASDDAAAA